MKNIQLKLNWLGQCVFKVSFCWERSSFLYHWPGSLCQRNTLFEQYVEKKWHDSNSTLEYVHNHMLPAMVVQRMVTARLHHVVNVMDVDRTYDSNKGESGSRHNYLLSYANHSWELSPEWWIFTSAHISALFSDIRKMLIPLHVTDDQFFSFHAALPQAHSFIHVACPINSAPSLTKSNTACPPPSALSLPKSFLLDCNSWRQTHIVSWCELEHFMDMISPSPQSSFFSVLGKSMAYVCSGKTTCQKWMARLHIRGVRACMHALSPSQQRLIPSRSHRNDGSLLVVEFSDHVQILPWASPSQYSQK